jgi:hypothetical protein
MPAPSPPTGVDVTVDRLMSEAEAAEFLDLAPQTLRHDRVHGQLGISYIKLRHGVRYRLSTLVKWIDGRERLPGKGRAA